MTQLLTEPVARAGAPSPRHRCAAHVSGGAKRVLTMSTIAFTLMFAVWLMFGILGVPIQKELGLTDPQLAWITAVAVLNGSLWRLPGRHAHRPDRRPRRHDRDAAARPRSPASSSPRRPSYLPLLVLGVPRRLRRQPVQRRHRVERRLVPQGPPGLRARRLRRRQRRRLGHQALIVLLPTIIASTAGATYLGIFPGGWRIFPAFYTVALVVVAVLTFVVVAAPRPQRGAGKPVREMLAPLQARAGLALQPLLRGRLRRLRRPRRLAAQVLRRQLRRRRCRRPRCSPRPSSSRHPCCDPSAAGSPTAAAPGGSCTGPSRVMAVTTGILMMPNGHLVIAHADGSQSEHLGLQHRASCRSPSSSSCSAARWASARPPSTSTSPSTSPTTSARSAAWSACSAASAASSSRRCSPTPRCGPASRRSTFFVLFLLTAACFAWMHWTVVHMLHHESPDLARHLESPAAVPADQLTPACGHPAHEGETAMSTAPAPARKGEWLESWDPENEQTWDQSLAWRTLWITTFCLTLAFVAWFLPSAIIPKLNALGYDFTQEPALLDGRHAGPRGRPPPPRVDDAAADHGHPQDGLADHPAAHRLDPRLGRARAVARPPPTGSSWCWPSSPASVAARSPASCRARPTSSPSASRARPWACRPGSATSASRSSSCSPRTSSRSRRSRSSVAASR